MRNLVVIFPMTSDSKWPTGGHFCSKSNFFAHNFKTNRDRDFVFVSKKGFLGMASLVVMFPMISDSKWLTGGHFVLACQHFYL